MNIIVHVVSVVFGIAVLLGIVILAIFIGAVFYGRAKQLLRGPKGIDLGKGLEKIQIGFSKYYHLILLIASYIVMVIILSKSIPKVWDIYRSSGIFWWSQIVIILSFWLFTLKSYGRTMAIVIWIFLLAVVTYTNWPAKKQNGDAIDTRQGVVDATVDVKSVKVVAPLGKWSDKIMARCNYDWAWNQSSDYGGWKNIETLVKIRANGDNGKIMEHGYRNNGSIAVARFPKDYVIKFIEIMSVPEENDGPVIMEIEFIKKS